MKSVTHDQWATNSTVPHAQPASELSDSSILESEDTLSNSDILLLDPVSSLEFGDICGSEEATSGLEGELGEDAIEEEDAEDWEEELEVTTHGGSDIHDWKTLHNQIQADLKK